MSSKPSSEIAPEVPPEVQNRRPVPLSVHAAEELGGNVPNEGPRQDPKFAAVAKKVPKKIAQAAKAVADHPALKNPHPCKGLSAAQIEEIRSRLYEDENPPAMHPNFGDLTPAFREWLKANHPEDYAVRYYARNV